MLEGVASEESPQKKREKNPKEFNKKKQKRDEISTPCADEESALEDQTSRYGIFTL